MEETMSKLGIVVVIVAIVAVVGIVLMAVGKARREEMEMEGWDTEPARGT